VAHFVGGPCDGQTTQTDGTPYRICGGVTYTLGAGGDYYTSVPVSGPPGTEVLGTHGPRAWADLQKAVNVSIPTGLSRAKGLTRGAHGKLMQRRRIR
jgi:hypothetical protein